MDLSSQQITFIGTGKMATALAAGFSRGLLKAHQIQGCDPAAAAREAFAAAVGQGCVTSADAPDVLSNATVIILAVKPGMIPIALQTLSAAQVKTPLVISIAAGITLETLQTGLPAGMRVVRVMPNTPCLVGEGACGATAGSQVTEADRELTTSLLQTVSYTTWVSEHLLDAVTGLSGSGPAYVFEMIEALSDGGVLMGLPRETSTILAAQTLAGAARMVLETGKHPGALKDEVTSPGGTTIAALHELERGGMRAALMNAVQASAIRSVELGRN
ncbi:MAG: pyrroline-5-carboxylate reductase [Planctomycetaceae bacterium]